MALMLSRKKSSTSGSVEYPYITPLLGYGSTYVQFGTYINANNETALFSNGDTNITLNISDLATCETKYSGTRGNLGITALKPLTVYYRNFSGGTVTTHHLSTGETYNISGFGGAYIPVGTVWFIAD